MELIFFIAIRNFITKPFLLFGIYTLATIFGGIAGIVLIFKRLTSSSEEWKIRDRSKPPECLKDPKYGRHSFVQLQEVKLHYVENGDRSKPLMLFVHGFPEFWFTWRKQLPVFTKTHWVVALDMRGFNESSKPLEGSVYQIKHLTKDIHDFVHALGRESCTLVGHDWGGVISWETAINYPKLIDKLIILNAPHSTAYSTLLTSSIGQILKSWYVFAFYLPRFLCEIILNSKDFDFLTNLFGKAISHDELEAYKYVWGRKDTWKSSLNYYTNGFQPTEIMFPPKRPMITSPTLIIWSKQDAFLSPELATLSAKYVKHPSVQIISKASHFAQWETPEEVNRLISDFIY